MSPRAAWRLESLGFDQIFDYAAGKADWAAAGFPIEGEAASTPRIGDRARRDVPTCRLTEKIGDVRDRVLPKGWSTCMVVNEQGVLLGRLLRSELEHDSEATAESVMRPGPSTFRPNVAVAEMVEYMARHRLTSAPVTTSEGVLVGLFQAEDAEGRR